MKLKFLSFWFCLLSIHLMAQELPPPNENSFYYGHCLQEVLFYGALNTNYLTIRKDDDSGDFLPPQFVKSYPSYCLDGGTITKQAPVAYVSGTKAMVKAVFLSDCTNSYYIRGIGPTIATGQITFPKQKVTPSNGTAIYKYRLAELPFVDGKVKYWEDFTITWEASETGADGSWVYIDESKNPLYVTHAPKISTVSVAFHTVIDVACKAANNENTPHNIVDKAFLPFKNLQVQRASDGYPLTYYGVNPPVFCGTVPQLLATGDGWCGAWATFFDEIIKTQGISNSLIRAITPPGTINALAVVPIDSNAFSILNNQINTNFPNATFATVAEFNIFVFLVKNWGNVTQGSFIPLTGATNIDEARSHPGLLGIPGQGNIQDPRSIFANHAAVSYNGKLYDSSYGRSYQNLNMSNYENISIDAVRGIIVRIHFNNGNYGYYFWVEDDNNPNISELQIY